MEENEQSRINFISCLKWVQKGVASTNPEKVQLSKDELVKIIKDTQQKLQIAKNEQGDSMDAEVAGQSSGPGDEFNLENYDNDEEDNNTANLLGINSLAELPTEAEDNFSDSDDSEKEDDVIKPKDNLILVGHVENDASVLEVYVYNEEEESLYVHHDILLPAFPLCFEWLNYEPDSPKGNYCAIGSMSPIIEVWDLDIVNIIEPAYSLGQAASRKKQREHIGHTDAVLALAWNRSFDHVMASGSVDRSILLWDLEKQVPNTTINVFSEKVQCLEWHKLEAETLLAGGCDKKARLFDCRSPEKHLTWELDGEAEKMAWNPLQPYMFIVGTSVGSLQCFDCRKGKLWSILAHEKEITGVSISSQCPGLLVTASQDGTVKTWDLKEEGTPILVQEKDFNMGLVHCLDLSPDLPFVIAAGGDSKSNNFTVFDLQNIDMVKHTFGSRSLMQLTVESSENVGAEVVTQC